ncbi:MAG TPA: DUF63 family protein [Methanosarcinaceae archaeon]|nr:DUF63 family protein [Methanosarcinaceae archaeon]
MSSVIDKILQFISTYYIDPIRNDDGYNIFNTITWALVLGACVFGVMRLLNRMKVTIDDKFILSVIPFVLAGSSLRVIKDAEFFNPPIQYLFITPNIYFVVFAVTVLCLVVSKWMQKVGKVEDYRIAFAAFGILWTGVNVSVLLYLEDIVQPMVPFLILGAASLLTFLIYKVSKYSGSELFSSKVNLSIVFAHLLDASSTIVGIDILGGYYEKHVIPSYLIDLTGTALIMYPLKFIIFVPVLYILDTQFNEDEESRALQMLVKMVIIILGLAPAFRNTIGMILGI